ncbi:hypothetical protein [Bifidobacterium aquikefiricola]|uniref:ABC transporter permease n=1 Tax=Bifidobacterium aquikefiricola TaxID=3059038 RepID=A0AB39U5N3_9BIFI
MRLAFQQWEFGKIAAKFLPEAAGDAVLGTSFLSISDPSQLLTPWQGMLVLGCYGFIMLLAGTIRLINTDVD